MTVNDRESFLAERKQGVGGSDVSSVFSLGYGCRLRLWFDKTGTPADYPDKQSGPMRLGSFLEPLIAEIYQERTGRTVNEEPLRVHPRIPEMIVHIDRTVKASERPTLGVAEFKAFGRGMFAKAKRDGLPIDYVLQVQSGLAIFERTWGCYVLLNRDNGDLVWFDVERDGQVTAMIEAEVPVFWQSVVAGEPPDRLDPDDKRCQSCRWRRTCQGNALMESTTSDIEQADDLRPLLAEYDERRVLFDEAEELLDETKECLRTALGERQAVEVCGRKVYYRPSQPKRWEHELMAAELVRLTGKPPAEIEKSYKLPGKVQRSLRVY